MAFRPDRLGASPPSPPGEIDYRLARQLVIKQFRSGRLSRHEVCDAHPELARAARNVGKESSEECPICQEAKLVLVSYVFGPGMPPSGRCVTTRKELLRLASGSSELSCHVVEVCPACSWNHLTRTVVLSQARSRPSVPFG
ncbi:MAG: DUF5318 family protein [Acidimicrobiales bacterium]